MRLIFIFSFIFCSFIGFSQYSRDGKGIKFMQLEGCKIDANGQPCDSCFVMTWGVNGKLNKCLHISQLREIIQAGTAMDSVYLITNGDGSYTLINEENTGYDFGYTFDQGTDTLYLLDHEGNIADYALITGMSGTTIDSFLILNDTLFISLTGDNEAAKKVLLHDYKQTLSFDSGTGDLGISFGNVVNLDGRYQLAGGGNGIYGGSDTIPDGTWALKFFNHKFGIGQFDGFGSAPFTPYNHGLYLGAGDDIYLINGDSIDRVASLNVANNALNGYFGKFGSYPQSTLGFGENGVLLTHYNVIPFALAQTSELSLIDSTAQLSAVSQPRQSFLKITGTTAQLSINSDTGNPGDALLSDGTNLYYGTPSGGATIDSVILKLSGNVMTSKVNTTSDTSLVIGSHTVELGGSVLYSQTNGVIDTADLSSLLTTQTTHTITQNGNQLTSVVNGVSDTTLTVRSNSLSYSGSILTSTINGVTDTALITTGGLISDVDLDLSGNILTSDVDGVNDTSLVIGTHLVNLSGNQITSNTNGVTDTTLVIGNVTSSLSGTILTTSVNGVSDTAQLSSLVSAATTNTLNGTGNIMTSTVNGVADTSLIINQLSLSNPANTITVNVNGETSSASAITSYSNGGTDNTSTISINGVGSASTTIIRSNRLVLGNDSLKTQINGIVSNAVPLDSILLNGITNNISLSGNTITSNVNTISDTCLAIGNNTLSYDQSSSIMTSSVNGISDTAYLGNFNVIQYVDSIKTRIDANSGIFSTGWSLYQDSQAPTYIAWDSLGYMNWKGGNVATYSGLPLGVLPYSTTGMNGAKFQINDSTTSNVNVLHINNKRTGNLIEDHTINTTHWIDTITQGYRSITAGALSSLQRGLVMDTMGMVGIGVSTPAYELDVTGSTRLNGHLYDINNSSGTNGDVLTRTPSGIDWVAPASNAPNIITPSQITSDQDDYNPTGFSDATIVRLSGDNGIRAITSMAAQTDGEEKTFINVGSYPLYFPSEHPDGTAANRFIFFEDIILQPLQSITFYYDGTSSRWRPINYTFNRAYNCDIQEAIIGSITAGDLPGQAYVNSGTGSGQASTSASSTIPFNYIRHITGTTSSGYSNMYIGKTGIYQSYSGLAHMNVEGGLIIPVLSNGTDSFTVFITLAGSAITSTWNVNNSYYIRYSHGLNGGNWTGSVVNNSGTITNVDLGVAVAANTVYNLRIELDKSRTEARFYIDGVFKGRITSNFPSAALLLPQIGINKGVGTTSTEVYNTKLRSVNIAP